MAVVDNPEHKKDVANEIAKAVRRGETVDRVTSEQVRTMDWKCPEHACKILPLISTEEKR